MRSSDAICGRIRWRGDVSGCDALRVVVWEPGGLLRKDLVELLELELGEQGSKRAESSGQTRELGAVLPVQGRATFPKAAELGAGDGQKVGGQTTTLVLARRCTVGFALVVPMTGSGAI